MAMECALQSGIGMSMECATDVASECIANMHINTALPLQGLYSLSGKTSYRKISWSLGAARLGVIMIVSLWNLTGISAALLPRCLSNFRAIGKVQTRISRLRDFTRPCGKTSYRLVNRGPEWQWSGRDGVTMVCTLHCHSSKILEMVMEWWGVVIKT